MSKNKGDDGIWDGGHVETTEQRELGRGGYVEHKKNGRLIRRAQLRIGGASIMLTALIAH